MPKKIIEYRCLLISPSDVIEERDAITKLKDSWNAHVGRGLGARLEIVRWESHSVPDLSGAPQDILNKQIGDDCDLGIAIFWSKLGTPTAEYPSGSIEEIYRLLQRNARVLTYFCSRAIPQKALQDDQYAKLQETRDRFKTDGLFTEYSDIASLSEQVNLHLSNVIIELLSVDNDITTFIPATGTLTAPTPDLRVSVRAAVFLKRSTPPPVEMLSISIQNHSPVSVFISSIYIETNNGIQVMLLEDFATGLRMCSPTEIQPGRSYSISVDPKTLMEYDSTLVCVGVRDEIGRVYRSSESELMSALKQLFRK